MKSGKNKKSSKKPASIPQRTEAPAVSLASGNPLVADAGALAANPAGPLARDAGLASARQTSAGVPQAAEVASQQAAASVTRQAAAKAGTSSASGKPASGPTKSGAAGKQGKAQASGRKSAMPELGQQGRLVALLLILLVAGGVRAWQFGSIPPGLNQDEASSGYEAWALMNHGVDRNGFHNPVHLVSWGSGQNALYSYLAMPFIAVFGLNPLGIRSLSLVFGLLTLLVFHRFVRRVSDPSTALCATLLLAVSPWHILICRWALESNLFPGVFLVGAWLLAKGTENPKFYPLAFAAFAVSLYAYGPAYLVVPIFLVLASAYLVYHGPIDRRGLLIGWVVFTVLGLPIGLYVLVNLMELQTLDLGLFSIPRLPGAARFTGVTSLFGGNLLGSLSDNFGKFLDLMLTQDDPRLFNIVPGFGYAYAFHWPFTLLGLGLVIKEVRFWRQPSRLFLPVAWFLTGLLLGFFYTDPNINRLNILFLPLVFFTAVGWMRILRWAWGLGSGAGKTALAAVALLYLVAFGQFVQVYFTDFPKRIGPTFFEGFTEAIVYAEKQAPGPICVTSTVNMPYIFVLLATQTDPKTFLSTVQWANPGQPFQRAASFGRYSFGMQNCSAGRTASFVLRQDEAQAVSLPGTRQSFGNYVVLLAQ